MALRKEITGSFLHIRRHMGIGVQSEGCVGVPQNAGEGLGVHPAGEGVSGESKP